MKLHDFTVMASTEIWGGAKPRTVPMDIGTGALGEYSPLSCSPKKATIRVAKSLDNTVSR
ncbi:MAG: hypothetical protein A3F82_03800 [Deltaproteobacteria bacterium RIFCSPLOWO2_12_FULL_44_12]|nr:MAG: hypothetical protein A3F82_03800 [Deltaproteobacteria bacterium RIFCSPLOWO2_12_FULL_44_12]